MGDRQDPGCRGALRGVEPGRRPPHLEHHLLGDFLGLGRITDHLEDQAIHRSREAVIHRLVKPASMGGTYEINNARVLCGNVRTANATVYIIDMVLMPPAS